MGIRSFFINKTVENEVYQKQCDDNWREKMNERIVIYPINAKSRKRLIAEGKMESVKYELMFMFDWGAGSCLWSNNEAANQRYGVGPIDLDELPLSKKLKKKLKRLCDKHDKALNWKCPQDGIVWSDKECCKFREQARVACWSVIKELNSEDYGVSFERDALI